MKNIKMFDTVIIGGGLGGMLCGALLAKKGQKICVLEQHSKLGGNLQSFKRKGITFDTGMHYFGSFDKGQIMQQIFKIFDIEKDIHFQKLDANSFDTITYKNKEYKFAQGFDNFEKQISEYFPQEKIAIREYVSKIKEIFNAITPTDIYGMDMNESFSIGAYDFIKSLTDNVDLQNVLAGTNPLYAGDKNKSPLYLHAVINSFFINSAYRFVGGGSQLADILMQKIESYGGEVHTQKKVTSFSYLDKKIEFCESENGEKFYATNFISAIHPANTIKIANTKLLKKAYRNRVSSLKNTIGSFAIYAKMKAKKFPYLNTNHYVYNIDDVWFESDKKNMSSFMLHTALSHENQEFADSVKIMTYMSFAEVEKWQNKKRGNRGKDYEDFKKQKAEELLSFVERKFPDFKNKIEEYYTSTPLTFLDYTGTPQGSMYGIERNFNNPIESYIPVNTKISNLFLTGQNINLHGILGVSIASLLTCSTILKEKITK